jgi:hypothetical protein
MVALLLAPLGMLLLLLAPERIERRVDESEPPSAAPDAPVRDTR